MKNHLSDSEIYRKKPQIEELITPYKAFDRDIKPPQ